jgi:hypothetical protein
MGLIVVQVVSLGSRSTETRGPSDVTEAAPTAASEAPEPAPIPEPDIAAPEAPSEVAAVEEKRKKVAARSTTTSWRPVKQAPAGTSEKPTSGSAPTPAPSAGASTSNQSKKVDAWDLDAFGDRH